MVKIHRMEIPVPFAVETVNVFLVEGETLTLIDTGTNTENARKSLEYQLGVLGYKIDDIETVVITHHHADHCGLLNIFSAHANVVGHPWNEPWITQNPQFLKRYQQFFKEAARQFGVPEAFLNHEGLLTKKTLQYSCKRSLTHTVREGDCIDALPEFQVIETPGHASTHISLYRERDGLLIGGDALIRHISSNPILEPPYEGESERARPLLQYNQTLRRLSEMNLSRILSGHGEDIVNVKELIESRLQKQETRALKVLELLKEKPMTAFEICVKLFPVLYKEQLPLTLSETVGQLDFLAYNQQVMIDESLPQLIYYAK
ncbi:MBL fold metallo-hydrolase [Bacillus cytotoxicus]|uniref:Beta-lactamase domain protein n=1 Tax=Bacillus cytotoxicus TaxID=580165 RepID=A0AAX2CKE0_9BACI|nr:MULTISPECIES: MBL fold metallo-hydrolase [Bacillus cereus group]AWC29716.1 hydrolase [Bacillus cytotoxicus]AWC41847.1 hydrolase [Bacillus cytotoxicus]AWC49778.1 hydrolase [Bacillus cytotoxicus]AWC53793.1 hydrolase [Bacillus cytotoxicus]AWC57919.1 hydrolase [Bacillus cytotoxicus]